MITRRAGVTLLAGLCVVAAGCQSTPTIASLFSRNKSVMASAKAPDQSSSGEGSFVLEQGMMVYWQAQPSANEPGQVKSGTGVVGPDGTMVVGPYGTCKVSGFTLDQATTALERQLAAYMKTPHVRLSMTAAAEPTEIDWRSARAGTTETQIVTPAEDVGASVQQVIWRR